MKDQHLFLVFAFSFMAAYRLTVSLNLRAILQMSLFAIPLTALIAQGEEGVTTWAYACLAVAVVWWFADLYLIFRSARIAYHGRQRFRVPHARPAQKPASGIPAAPASSRPQRATPPAASEPEKVQMVSIKPSDIEYGPVIGLVDGRPIYEWIVAKGREGRAEYVGILGKGTDIEDDDLMLAPGLIYRWDQPAISRRVETALESA